MKWVKASERLPPIGKELHLRLLGQQFPRVGKMRADNYFATNSSLIYYPNIEWLDEDSPDYYQQRCEAAEKVIAMSVITNSNEQAFNHWQELKSKQV